MLVLQINIQVWVISLVGITNDGLVYYGAMLGPYPLIYARGELGLVVAEW